MKRHTFLSIVAVILIVCSIFFSGCTATDTTPHLQEDNSSYENVFSYSVPEYTFANTEDLISCELIRVVDGDTIVVMFEGKQMKVRFIGVNTPESVTGNSNRDTQEGVSASEFTKNLLSNSDIVYIELDKGKYDKYDRLLAYVYTEDGVQINALLLQNGLARTMFYKPNYKYQTEFNEIQDYAKSNKIGFWGINNGSAMYK